jgi:hypothetical protein
MGARNSDTIAIQILCLFGVQLLAVLCAEICILNDELAFVREVVANEQVDTTDIVHRPRSWPNRTGELLYSKSRGFYSED